ncbi:sarcosine oxidase subunit gamma [Stella humosa]|uniref:Sarcosine oxidase subunit gamma n=1 Tax=Stella humosa TaxID=94 RepID=A0A3N1L0Q6_9PROT|nr:sarcosine oxidase subunit gamma family protein [Stella humosa]ROP84178.1 sarcosine oxidase subunit gamma [Stella humosa]BBK33690.1 hypothetical protein STHU_43240 [Stella humosa]
MSIRIEARDLRIAEAPACRRLLLRARADDAVFADEVRWVFGIRPPALPCTATENEHARCLWLDPTCWLVESGDREAELAFQRLAPIEVTDARLVLTVEGRRARDLLAVGTGIDLHPAAFPPGRVVRTLFGRLGATLYLADAAPLLVAPLFHLHVDRAAERWLADWLAAAVRGLDL